MAFLDNVNQLRSVNWGGTWLWDIKFEDMPAPFHDWFPAQDIEENVYSLESRQIEGYNSTYKIPKSTTVFDLKITFIDDELNTALRWLTVWVNSVILGGGTYVRPLDEVVRQVTIMKLTPDKVPVQTVSYYVYPEGAIYFHGTSDSGVPQYSVDFVIAGLGSIDDSSPPIIV